MFRTAFRFGSVGEIQQHGSVRIGLGRSFLSKVSFSCTKLTPVGAYWSPWAIPGLLSTGRSLLNTVNFSTKLTRIWACWPDLALSVWAYSRLVWTISGFLLQELSCLKKWIFSKKKVLFRPKRFL